MEEEEEVLRRHIEQAAAEQHGEPAHVEYDQHAQTWKLYIGNYNLEDEKSTLGLLALSYGVEAS